MASKNHSHTNLASTFTLVSWAEKFTFGPKTFKQHWVEYSFNLSYDDSSTSRISLQNSVLELLINWGYQKKQLLNCIIWDKNQQTYIFVSDFMWHPVSQTLLCQNSPSQWFFTVIYSLLPFETGLIKKKKVCENITFSEVEQCWKVLLYIILPEMAAVKCKCCLPSLACTRAKLSLG